jgi:O-antigen/teichoic acid export membrane protein
MASQVEISKRLLLINSASSIAAHILQVSVLFWMNLHLLRRVSDAEYSLSPLVYAILGFIPLFTMVLTSGLGRYLLNAYAKGDEKEMGRIVSSMVPLLSFVGLLLLVVGGLAAWYVDWILVIPEALIWDARLMIFLMIFCMAVQLPCSPLGLGLYIQQKFVLSNLISVGADIFKSALLLVLLLGVSSRVLWVVVASAAGQIFSLIVSTMISLHLVPALRYRYQSIRWDLVRAITGFGGWNFLVGLAGRTREFAIPLILNHLGTYTDTVTYQVGSMPRRQIDLWFEVASRPLHPMITGMHAVGADERFRNAYLRCGRVGLWVILSAAIPAMVYAAPMMNLYMGSKYSDGAYIAAAFVLVCTLACSVLSSGNWMTWCMANAKGHMRPVGICVSLTQLVSVVLILVATGRFHLGASGAVFVSFVVSSFSAVFLMLPVGLRLADVSLETWIERTFVPGIAPACVAAVAWVALDLQVQPDSWFELGWCTAVGGLVYAVVLLGCCLDQRDKQDLEAILARAKVKTAVFRGGHAGL